MENLKQRIHGALDPASAENRTSIVFNYFLAALILANLLAVVLESVHGIHSAGPLFFRAFDVFSVAVFTAEYLLRAWICTLIPGYERPVIGRIRYLLTPMALVDLAAVLPFYLPFFLALDLRIIRTLRLLRLVRVLKLGRYSNSLKLMGEVFKSKKEELVLTGGIIVAALVIASTLIYFVEHETQPEAFSSIPAAMWWAVVTLTTVGFGDVLPMTAAGKLLTGLIAVLGIGLFALPAGIMGSGFTEALAKRNSRNRMVCPHCGHEIETETVSPDRTP